VGLTTTLKCVPDWRENSGRPADDPDFREFALAEGTFSEALSGSPVVNCADVLSGQVPEKHALARHLGRSLFPARSRMLLGGTLKNCCRNSV
jgi:hypothetical protein